MYLAVSVFFSFFLFTSRLSLRGLLLEMCVCLCRGNKGPEGKEKIAKERKKRYLVCHICSAKSSRNKKDREREKVSG